MKTHYTSILVVDDDHRNCTLLGAVLTRKGYNVFIANNGRQALEICTEENIQFVITDINMPVMDGIELCEILRGSNSESYIYAMSGNAQFSFQKIRSIGFDDYFTKPFSVKNILDSIEFDENHGERLQIGNKHLMNFNLNVKKTSKNASQKSLLVN